MDGSSIGRIDFGAPCWALRRTKDGEAVYVNPRYVQAAKPGDLDGRKVLWLLFSDNEELPFEWPDEGALEAGTEDRFSFFLPPTVHFGTDFKIGGTD